LKERNDPEKIAVMIYMPPKLYHRVLQLLKEWQETTRVRTKVSPFVVMIIEEGLPKMEERIRKMKG